MESFLPTLALAFIIITLAIIALAIGLLITGKSKIVRGACGMDPNKKKEDCDKAIKCGLCEKDGKIEKTDCIPKK